MPMAQVLLSPWRGSASAESFSRPCCCPGPWKPQRDSPGENLMALFSLLLVALLTVLGAALHVDSSPKEPGKDGMLNNIHSLIFLINIFKNNAQTIVLLWARSIYSSLEEHPSDTRMEGENHLLLDLLQHCRVLLPLCRKRKKTLIKSLIYWPRTLEHGYCS